MAHRRICKLSVLRKADLLRELQLFEDSLHTDVSDVEDCTWYDRGGSKKNTVGTGGYYEPVFQSGSMPPDSISSWLLGQLCSFFDSCIAPSGPEF